MRKFVSTSMSGMFLFDAEMTEWMVEIWYVNSWTPRTIDRLLFISIIPRDQDKASASQPLWLKTSN